MKKQVIILSIILILVLAGSVGVYQYIIQLQKTLEITQETNTQLMETLEENTNLVSQYQASAEELDDSFQQLFEILQNRLHQNNENYKELLVSEGEIIAQNGINTSSYVTIYSYDDNIITFGPKYYLTDDYLVAQIAKKDEIEQTDGLSKIELRAYNELSVVIEHLSGHYFSFLPIEIDKIETTEQGIIATLNLSEIRDAEKYPQYYSWKSGYFQGSSGGMYTEDTLLYNLLQPDKSDWLIDGVDMTYEHNPINQFEHVLGLSETVMRSTLQKLN